MVHTQRVNNCATAAITTGRPADRAVRPVFQARADGGRGVTQFLGVVGGGGTRVRSLCALHPRRIDPAARRAAAVRGTSEQLTTAVAGTKTKTNNKRRPAETTVIIMIYYDYNIVMLIL